MFGYKTKQNSMWDMWIGSYVNIYNLDKNNVTVFIWFCWKFTFIDPFEKTTHLFGYPDYLNVSIYCTIILIGAFHIANNPWGKDNVEMSIGKKGEDHNITAAST